MAQFELPANIERVKWDFGDGTYSEENFPIHIYAAPAVYTVCLTAWTDTGSELSMCHDNYVTATQWSIEHGFDVSKTNICYRFGKERSDGIGPSEVSGDGWVYPNGSVQPIQIKDKNGVPRLIIIDQNDRRFYEITAARGAESLGHIPVWKDKVKIDGTGGLDYTGSVSFRGATGSLERYFLEVLSMNLYTRPVAKEIRNNYDQSYFDDHGYPVDLKVKFEVRTEDQSKEPDVEAQGISLPKHEVVFDKRVEGHYINTKVEWDKAPFQIVGLTQNLIAKDHLDTPTGKQMEEGTIQETLSNMSGWYTRGPSLITNQVNGRKLSWDEGINYQRMQGPDGVSDSALMILSGTELILPPCDAVIFWYYDNNDFASMPSGFKVYKTTENHWVLGYLDSYSAAATFKHGLFFDIRWYGGSALTYTDPKVLEYIYRDVAIYNGTVNLPAWTD